MDRKNARHNFITDEFPKRIERIKSEFLDQLSVDLQGHGVKMIIPPNLIDKWTKSAVFLGMKLSGHSVIVTEASNLLDGKFKKVEIQNVHQYRNAPNKLKSSRELSVFLPSYRTTK